MIDITDRDKAIGALSAAVGFVGGLWFGYLTVPAELLRESITNSGPHGVSSAVLPAPSVAPMITFGVLFIGAWIAYSVTRPDDELDDEAQPSDELTATDGGLDRDRREP